MDEAELLLHWTKAGFVKVKAGRIAVTRVYQRFDDLWLPLLVGSTPSTLKLASLAPSEREAVRSILEVRFDPRSVGGLVEVTAEALVVSSAVAASAKS